MLDANFLRGDWVEVNVGRARELRATTERTDIAIIAWDMTGRRVAGKGPSFHLTEDTSKSEQLLHKSEAEERNRRILMQANQTHIQERSRLGDAHKSIPLNDLVSAVISEWKDFTEHLDMEILRQGFALISRSPSQHHPDVMVPHIEDITYYRLFTRYLPQTGRQYLALWDNLTEFQQQTMKIKNGEQIQNSELLVARNYEPTVEGQLKSKLAAAAPLIDEVLGLEETIAYGTYWMAHPVYVPQLPDVSNSAMAAKDGVGAPGYASYRDVLQDRSAVAAYHRAERRDEAEHTAADAYQRHLMALIEANEEKNTQLQRTLTHNNYRVQHARDINVRHARTPPFCTDYPMNAGGTVVAGPKPALPPDVSEYKKDLARRAYLTLDAHPQLVSLEHRNHAANADVAFAGQNDMIKSRQATLEPLLAQAFRFVYEVDLKVTEQILNDGDEVGPPPKPGAPRIGGHSAAESSVRLAHRVRAELSSTPLTSSERLVEFLQHHVIDHATYRAMALETASVSPYLASTESISPETVDSWFHKPPDIGDAPDAKKKKRKSASDTKEPKKKSTT